MAAVKNRYGEQVQYGQADAEQRGEIQETIEAFSRLLACRVDDKKRAGKVLRRNLPREHAPEPDVCEHCFVQRPQQTKPRGADKAGLRAVDRRPDTDEIRAFLFPGVAAHFFHLRLNSERELLTPAAHIEHDFFACSPVHRLRQVIPGCRLLAADGVHDVPRLYPCLFRRRPGHDTADFGRLIHPLLAINPGGDNDDNDCQQVIEHRTGKHD